MFNATAPANAAPAGFGTLVLIADPSADGGAQVIERPPRALRRPPAAAPLERTDLRGTVTGPLASFALVQRFRVPESVADAGAVEARYRFPLPGDAAVVGVVVRFGDVEVRTQLAERDAARAEYDAARRVGHQAALLEREAANVFTLSVAGVTAAEAIEVETRYVQRAAWARGRWSLRVPLTTAPRYTRDDERALPQATAKPLGTLRDPGHRFALDVTLLGAGPLAVASPTHALRAEPAPGGATRVRLDAGDVVPDRDFVLTWRPAEGAAPALHATAEDAGGHRYVLALVTAPAARAELPRDLLLLVDRSGSMAGAKWAATRWAVRRLLAALGPSDRFHLGAFDNDVEWLAAGASGADDAARAAAERFLDANGPRGGTELGVALESALVRRPRAAGDSVARHCLVITDGQVTDEARILATVEREAARADARRVSVLCIDSAPNASLAGAVAERGRGVAHFLSSDPGDGDVATALEDALEAFDAPVATGLTLHVDRAGVEAAARAVAHEGTTTRVDLGDVVAGRAAWVVLRLPADEAPGATYRVSASGEELASWSDVTTAPGAPDGAVRAAFGADRVRALETVLATSADADATRAALTRLGYAAEAVTRNTVYAETAALAMRDAVRALLVRESLETGVPSSATSFVAVRAVNGRPAERTYDVACALPAGWAPSFAEPAQMLASPQPAAAMRTVGAARRSRARPSTDHDAKVVMRTSGSFIGGYDSPAHAFGEMMSAPAPSAPLATRWDGVPPRGDEIVLFDSARENEDTIPWHITRILLTITGDAGALPRDVALLLYVGDLAEPAARVDVRAVLRAGGERPLNVRRGAGDRVRLVLSAAGGWPAAAGALSVTLE